MAKRSLPADMPKRPQTIDRYAKIYRRFQDLCSQRIGKHPKYTRGAVQEMLAREHYCTVEGIRRAIRFARILEDHGQLPNP